MNKATTRPLILGLLGLAIGTLLPSRVEPYGPSQRASSHSGNYRPGYDSNRPRHEDSYSRRGRPEQRREIIVTSLPRGCREVGYRNNRYYQPNGVYYQQWGSGYVVVSRPY